MSLTKTLITALNAIPAIKLVDDKYVWVKPISPTSPEFAEFSAKVPALLKAEGYVLADPTIADKVEGKAKMKVFTAHYRYSLVPIASESLIPTVKVRKSSERTKSVSDSWQDSWNLFSLMFPVANDLTNVLRLRKVTWTDSDGLPQGQIHFDIRDGSDGTAYMGLRPNRFAQRHLADKVSVDTTLLCQLLLSRVGTALMDGEPITPSAICDGRQSEEKCEKKARTELQPDATAVASGTAYHVGTATPFESDTEPTGKDAKQFIDDYVLSYGIPWDTAKIETSHDWEDVTERDMATLYKAAIKRKAARDAKTASATA